MNMHQIGAQYVRLIFFFFLFSGCDSLFNEYEKVDYDISEIDHQACDLFFFVDPLGSITTHSLEDTSFTLMDSLYAFVLGDSSNVLGVNNIGPISIVMTADTCYFPFHVEQGSDSIFFFGDASIDMSIFDSIGDQINILNHTSSLENIAGCHLVRTRSVFSADPGYYVLRFIALEQKDFRGIVLNSNIPPEADFLASSTIGIDSLYVTFSDASVNGTYSISDWRWDFGDGSTDSSRFLANPTHVYSSSDTFTVSLMVSDGVLSHTEEKIDYIKVSSSNE